jgi:hypothetical protein
MWNVDALPAVVAGLRFGFLPTLQAAPTSKPNASPSSDGTNFTERTETMKKMIFAALFATLSLFSASSLAAMTDAQLQTLATAIRADSTPAVVTALAQRNDTELVALYSVPTAVVVWKNVVTPSEWDTAMMQQARPSVPDGR